jgi:hypothetical protein
VISYTHGLTTVREDMLRGFFVGWPRRPSPAQHLAVLRASYRSVIAIDDAAGCDAELLPYYARFGMASASGALLRHPAALADLVPADPR